MDKPTIEKRNCWFPVCIKNGCSRGFVCRRTIPLNRCLQIPWQTRWNLDHHQYHHQHHHSTSHHHNHCFHHCHQVIKIIITILPDIYQLYAKSNLRRWYFINGRYSVSLSVSLTLCFPHLTLSLWMSDVDFCQRLRLQASGSQPEGRDPVWVQMMICQGSPEDIQNMGFMGFKHFYSHSIIIFKSLHYGWSRHIMGN